ncbi:MAG: WbqC family protein [bacterium]
MTILISTAYLPPISYMAACLDADEVLIEAQETYPKQTFRNRCCIYGPNGKQALIIPVRKPDGNHTKTKDIRLDSSVPWRKHHWRSFEAGYNKSPYFLYYKDDFQPFFHRQYTFLIDFNTGLLETLFRMIRLEKKVKFTDRFEERSTEVEDMRFTLSSKHQQFEYPAYIQVFSSRHGFIPNLSVIDLLFNLGPEARNYLSSL